MAKREPSPEKDENLEQKQKRKKLEKYQKEFSDKNNIDPKILELEETIEILRKC